MDLGLRRQHLRAATPKRMSSAKMYRGDCAAHSCNLHLWLCSWWHCCHSACAIAARIVLQWPSLYRCGCLCCAICTQARDGVRASSLIVPGYVVIATYGVWVPLPSEINKQISALAIIPCFFESLGELQCFQPCWIFFFFLKCLNRWGFDRWRWLIQQVHSVPCQPVTDAVQAQPGLRSSAKDFQCDLGKSLNLLELIFPNCRGDMMFYLWVRAFHTNLERTCSFFLLSTLDFSAERHCWSFNPFPSSLFLLVSLFLRARWLQHKISDCATSNVVVSGWKLPFTHLSVLVFPAGGGTPILSVQVCSLKSWSATKKTNVRCSNARNWLRSISAALVQLRR